MTNSDNKPGTIESVDTEESAKSGFYPRWKVLMHNDDKTHMDFVIGVLTNIFGVETQQAVKIMWEIHTRDVGLAGVFPKEQAEFRIEQSHSLARTQGFPLTCSMEEE